MSGLPGDPNLPPGVTERMIEGAASDRQHCLNQYCEEGKSTVSACCGGKLIPLPEELKPMQGGSGYWCSECKHEVSEKDRECPDCKGTGEIERQGPDVDDRDD